jgi:endonuclease/exonuclease/phosphatase (EEP) superfamily protein YafD
MRGFFAFLCMAIFCFQSTAHADFVVPPDTSVLTSISTGAATPLPNHLNLISWNIHKASDGEAWQADFEKLASGQHIAAIQEGVEDPIVLDTLRSLASFGWLMARSFFMETDHRGTGVITGATQEAVSSLFLRSPDTEPVINTPKVALLTTYQMQDGSRLLVVNIHAINFTAFAPFQRQMDQVAGIIRGWQGRVIWVGDFNTWSSTRQDYLKKVTAAVGLKEVVFGNDPRKMVLDHIFLRGCSQLGAEVHSEIPTSDHFPLTTGLLCAD